ncbi:MAG: HTTM domain-containing protein [Pirellulaceae bacterium]
MHVFAIDPRSLAAFRIGVAAILLLDLGWRAWDVTAFATDAGVLPRVLLIEMRGAGHPAGLEHAWSLHLLNGQAWAALAMHGVAAWFACWLLVGYRTRLATLASWILLVSVVNRNPLITDAGDSVLRSMLFWALFLPLGRRWSVDAAWRAPCGTTLGRRGPVLLHENTPVLTWASAAILLQLLIVYFAAAIYKLDRVWTTEFSAVYYVMNCDAFVTSAGVWLRQFPAALRAMTAATMLLEFGGPLLLLVPVGNRAIRWVVVASFVAFHLGLAVSMTLGLFPWICIVCWLLFLPGETWDACRQAMGRRGRELARRFDELARASWWRRPEVEPVCCRRLQAALAAAFLLYAVAWNTMDLVPTHWARTLWPEAWNGVATAVGLERGWTMFAPVPHRDDGWPIFRGTLHDGTEVNLWEPGQPLPMTKPRLVSRLYHGQRWRRCIENILMENFAWHRPYFADWLQQRWNREQSGGQPQREVATVEILRCLEPTPPPGEPFLPVETVTLWTKHYASSADAER